MVNGVNIVNMNISVVDFTIMKNTSTYLEQLVARGCKSVFLLLLYQLLADCSKSHYIERVVSEHPLVPLDCHFLSGVLLVFKQPAS